MPSRRERSPTLSFGELMGFWRVYRIVGGGRPPWSYLRACLLFRKRLRADLRLLNRVCLCHESDSSESVDNTRDLEEGVTYRYRGLDEATVMVKDGKPLVFIAWHQGAYRRNYALARVLPVTAIFSRDRRRYGTILTQSMGQAKGLSLAKVAGFLGRGRPIMYSIDGIPLGETVSIPVLGCPMALSTAPIRVMRAIEGVRLVPVTCYYRGAEGIELIFHPPFPPPEQLADMSDIEVLQALISYFEKDLIKEAPEQVRWRMWTVREAVARQ